MRSEGIPGGIVDAHHHLWDLHAHAYGWLSGEGDPGTTRWIGDYASIRRSYPVQEFVDDAVPEGVVRSVHVEALWGAHSLGETRWLQSVADTHGFPQAIVAAVDLRRRSAAAELDRHLAHPNLRGVRMAQMGGLVAEPAFRRGFAALAERGLTYDLNIRAEESRLGADLAAAFPGTPIAIDNMANPTSLDPGELTRWRRQLRVFSDAPNVAMKVSGLGMADHRPTLERVRPWVAAAIELFGPDRCMFGSNWPVDRLYGSYAGLVATMRSATADLPPAGRAAFFRTTAERWYRI